MLSKITIYALVFIGIAGGLWFVLNSRGTKPSGAPAPTAPPKSTLQPTDKLILHDVPFVVQASTGNWDDERQQDGCEEAASYMAVLWARGEMPPTTASGVEQKLLEISDWEERTYGSYHDTSVKDTVERIFKGYFDYDNVEVKYDINAEDIKRELYNGNLVIVPADGQKLNNPYFTAPGPERHMLPVKGYDPETDEFITNDNGTKRGEGYRYKSSILLGAIWDYPTGDHFPIAETRRAMIVVKK